MKKLFLLSYLTVLLFSFEWQNDYNKGISLSQKTQKIAMIMLSSETCDVCQYMKHKVFTDNALEYAVRSRFIPIEIDIVKQEIPQGLRALGTPTFYFIDPQTKRIIKRLVGGAKAEDFLEELQKIKK